MFASHLWRTFVWPLCVHVPCVRQRLNLYATLIAHLYAMSGTFIWPLCAICASTYVPFVLSWCYFYAIFIWTVFARVCGIYVAFTRSLRYVYGFYATFVWHVCCFYMIFMRFSCDLYVTSLSPFGVFCLTYLRHLYYVYITFTRPLYDLCRFCSRFVIIPWPFLTVLRSCCDFILLLCDYFLTMLCHLRDVVVTFGRRFGWIFMWCLCDMCVTVCGRLCNMYVTFRSHCLAIVKHAVLARFVLVFAFVSMHRGWNCCIQCWYAAIIVLYHEHFSCRVILQVISLIIVIFCYGVLLRELIS